MGAVFGEAVRVVGTQGARQRVSRVGCAQQVAVTLHGIFAFQYGNHDRARGHELDQTVEERFTIVLGIETARLLNGQVQHFRTDNFEPCCFKARKDVANNVFCHRIWFDDGKSTFNRHDYLCNVFCCCIYACTTWRGL
ncbi:hypothetical protein CKO_00266 [Citrobacter koseri ATCC BAA-895]|uniref:Uncharacterized protein n=1 Tax=Citrobacter koseri (strain ATCC BAA-895 / CDC 4225-83 / SGSC4696) TaxID=290338 RepID=A8AD66_CITK8|nr:hypothetical protein CKO_00266 [Citrobacter koseri ATCC BAA-895]